MNLGLKTSRRVAEFMARPEGLEPPTYSSGGWRSIQLSYGRTPMSSVYQLGWPAVAAQMDLGEIERSPQDGFASTSPK
jgi:hypothetical protein